MTEALPVAENGTMRVRNRTFAFEPELLREHWNDGDPCLTHTFSVASIILELGEAFLVERVARVMPDISDTAVRGRAKIFAAQESTHRHMHSAYNRVLTSAGYRTGLLYKAVRLFVQGLGQLLSRRWMLASLVSVEYLAALTAERLFDGCLGQTVNQADTEVARFWRWHLAEEAEHRMVMHEVYRHFGGSTRVLTLMTWAMGSVFYLFLNLGMVWLVLTGPAPRRRLPISLFHYNFGRMATFFWLPARLLRATWQRFDPARVCRHTKYEPHLGGSSPSPQARP